MTLYWRYFQTDGYFHAFDAGGETSLCGHHPADKPAHPPAMGEELPGELVCPFCTSKLNQAGRSGRDASRSGEAEGAASFHMTALAKVGHDSKQANEGRDLDITPECTQSSQDRAGSQEGERILTPASAAARPLGARRHRK